MGRLHVMTRSILFPIPSCFLAAGLAAAQTIETRCPVGSIEVSLLRKRAPRPGGVSEPCQVADLTGSNDRVKRACLRAAWWLPKRFGRRFFPTTVSKTLGWPFFSRQWLPETLSMTLFAPPMANRSEIVRLFITIIVFVTRKSANRKSANHEEYRAIRQGKSVKTAEKSFSVPERTFIA